MSIYIIDFQGFHSQQASSSFILKELSIVDLNSDRIIHNIAKPPFQASLLSREERNSVIYLQTFHHKILWNDGIVEYSELFEILRKTIRDAKTIYIKGSERANFLRNIIYNKKTDIIDLEFLDCPRASTLPEPKILNNVACAHPSHCLGEKNRGVCSLNQALKYKMWLAELFAKPGFDEVD